MVVGSVCCGFMILVSWFRWGLGIGMMFVFGLMV